MPLLPSFEELSGEGGEGHRSRRESSAGDGTENRRAQARGGPSRSRAPPLRRAVRGSGDGSGLGRSAGEQEAQREQGPGQVPSRTRGLPPPVTRRVSDFGGLKN